MARPTQTISLVNSTLEVLILPAKVRTVTKHNISLASALPEESDVVSLVAEVDGVEIKAGTSLSFISPTDARARRHLLIVQDALLGTSPLNVEIAPAERAVDIDSTAVFVEGLIPLFGIEAHDLTRNDTMVDITNMQSGTGTENRIVRRGRNFNITGIEMEEDEGLHTVIKVVSNSTVKINREVYAVLTRPNGEKFAGAALVANLSEPGNKNDVMKYSFQLQYQRDPEWTPAYRFN